MSLRLLLSFSLLFALAVAQRPNPPAPVVLNPAQRQQLDASVSEIHSLLAQLRQKKADPALITDVAIFHKAGVMLQEHPDEFFVPEDVPKFLGVLAQGVERGRQLLAGQAPWTTQKSRRLHGYVSALDGSVQPYGLRVPDSYDGSKPVKLYVWLHGRERALTEAAFLDRAQKITPGGTNPADEGQIQLDVYGRWNGIAYHWAGEVDVFEAIAAVQARYKIDPERILLRGFSMGGCGAWHIALHHPGYFAAAEIGAGTWPLRSQLPGFPAYQAGPLRIYENIIDWSLNAFNLPIAGHGGENETGTSSIPPPPPGTKTRGQLESSLRVRAQLEKEGFPSEGDPFDLHVPGTPARFFISKNTGHGTGPEVRAKLDAFLKEHGDRGRTSPDHIRFVTFTTRYPHSHWVTVDHLAKHFDRADLNARRLEAGRRYEVSTQNITRFTLRELTQAREVAIDGQKVAVKPAAQITFERTANRWAVAKPTKGLWKTHRQQGPIDDAFMDPFLLVRPTGQPWNPEAHAQALRLLSRFDRLYAKGLRAHPRIKDDKDVTPADLAQYNLVLFGDPGSNRWIAKLQGKTPLQWTRERVAFGSESFPAAGHLPAIIYPNPLAPKRYAVINSGMTIEDREFTFEYGMPRLGDFAILKVKPGAEWPDIATAGLFNERWQLP
jgi:pimeloyl-ACP methyl ester carboxylesterase